MGTQPFSIFFFAYMGTQPYSSFETPALPFDIGTQPSTQPFFTLHVG